jgi:hypothetical protein
MARHSAHIAAGLRATAADFGAGFHFIAIERRTRYGAGFANLGAGGAFGGMMAGPAHHEIGGGLTGLDAIVHQHGMVMRHMCAALIEAMVIKGILAGIAALPAQFDTNLYVFGMGSHGATPFASFTKPPLVAFRHEIARPN